MISIENYREKIYAGVLGKIIGVYLGRPIEDWTYERIIRELGEIKYYVSESFNQPIVVTDDDISGTFTFYRALEDFPNSGAELSSLQIGNTWLNYIIENRSVFWWGGKGISTEHTAYLRLREGIPAPLSGSAKINGKIVAEQIGAQIFIESWGMVTPGNPLLATQLAGRAARVSHDGEAVISAQMIAAMVSLAFIKQDVIDLINDAKSFIDKKSLTRRVVDSLLDIKSREKDWHKAREYIVNNFGYDKYRGSTPVIPNFALVILGLIYSNGNFQKGLCITNTSGWDTDCNSGNVGCILGILGGLKGINENSDFRGPVADRLYIPTADGGRAITDAVQEAHRIADTAEKLLGHGHIEETASKEAAKRKRFNFSFPGSVQGFHADTAAALNQKVKILNVKTTNGTKESRALQILIPGNSQNTTTRVLTDTFITPESLKTNNYLLDASPTIYPGQNIIALLENKGDTSIRTSLFVRTFKWNSNGKKVEALTLNGKSTSMKKGEKKLLTFTAPETGGLPISAVGIEINSSPANLLIHYMDWTNTPHAILFKKSALPDNQLIRPWVQACDILHTQWDSLIVSQSRERGFALQGSRLWRDYTFLVKLEPKLFLSAGLVVAFQGLRRYISVELLPPDTIEIVEYWDNDKTILNKTKCPFEWEKEITIRASLSLSTIILECSGITLSAKTPSRLTFGAVGIVVESGSVAVNHAEISPLKL